MFVIMPKSPVDWQQAMFMLSYYHVGCKLYSDGEDAGSTYMVVGDMDEGWSQEDEDNLALAEMCFQMNWHQVGTKCPHCANDKEDGEQTCGHLTFSHLIDTKAFDKIFG